LYDDPPVADDADPILDFFLDTARTCARFPADLEVEAESLPAKSTTNNVYMVFPLLCSHPFLFSSCDNCLVVSAVVLPDILRITEKKMSKGANPRQSLDNTNDVDRGDRENSIRKMTESSFGNIQHNSLAILPPTPWARTLSSSIVTTNDISETELDVYILESLDNST
jgi:hypothetical protein